MTVDIYAGDKNPAYATYVGRVGALAIALGIGAAMATGHGLGLGVAYATEGDPSPDTSQDGDTNEHTGDDAGATPPAQPAPAAAPGSSTQPRSPLARIASVPKMIFNATGGAQRSTATGTQPRLPRLSTVLEDVASAVTNNLPKLPAPAQGSAAQGNPTAGQPAASRSAANTEGRDLVPAVTSLPASVAKDIKALVSLPAVGRMQSHPAIAPNSVVPSGVQRQALVDNGQQNLVQPSAALVQTPTNPPSINPVGVVTRLLTVALSGLVAPGPAAPTDPPLLLGVLAWARREFQLNFFNRTPNAIPDAVSTFEDVTPPAGNVLTNDRAENPDGATETLTVTDPRTQTTDKGTLVLNADGSYTYTPKPNATGQDVFTYTVSDEASRPHIHGLSGLLYGGGHTDTGTLTINITPVNDAPVAVDDTVNATEDTPKVIQPATLLANDTDVDGPTKTITGVSNAAHGTVALNNGVITFTPETNYNGNAAGFDYTVSDGTDTDTGRVTVNIAAVNDAPVAVDDTVNATEDTPKVIQPATLLANDTDVDGPTKTITGVSNAAHGTVALNNGVITFTPETNYNGNAAGFDYTVSDGTDTDTGRVTVNIAAVNDAPIITVSPISNTGTGSATYTASATDVDDTNVTYSVTTQPTKGSVTKVGTNTFVYTPDPVKFGNQPGTDTFVITANDGHSGGTSTQQVSYTFTPEYTVQVANAGSPNIRISDDGKTAIVFNGSTVTIIDASGATPVVTPVPASASTPYGSNFFALSADGTRAYVSDHAGNPSVIKIVNIGPNPSVTPVSINDDFHSIATNADGSVAYAQSDNGRMYKIDAAGNATPVNGVSANSVGTNFQHIAVSADGTRVMFVDYTGKLTVLNNDTPSPSVTGLPVNTDLVAGDDATRGYMVGPGNTVSYINAENATPTVTSVILTATPTATAGGLAVSDDGKRAFVTTSGNAVSIIDTSTTTPDVESVSLTGTPRSVAVNDDGTIAYVTMTGNRVAVIDTSGTVTTVDYITFGSSPTSVAVSDDGTRAFVTLSNGTTAVVTKSVTV